LLTGESWILDTWGNHINALATYGPDPRNGYYVYSPPNTSSSSPIVVLIHGGGWFSGPNPDNVNGWGFSYSDSPASTNLVKDLMAAGYVVVVPLYRLGIYGKNDAEISANTVNWQAQIDDIDAAILHIRSYFPTCLGIDANSIQVLGESSGGHLALMWAYTKSTLSTSIVKSVISCYAPTDLQTYGQYLRNKSSVNLKYKCGTNYYFPLNINQFPYYPFWFHFEEASIYMTYSSASAFNCIPYSGGNAISGWKVVDSTYNLIQSGAGLPITSPSANSTLAAYSPKNALVSRIIPTFIMHSDAGSDKLAPYNQCGSNMSSSLSLHGGLIATLTTNTASVNYSYSTLANKHLIKLFPGADHGWVNTSSATKDSIRSNIKVWLNGHK
jgi:dienelactone hydrolase